MTIDDIKEGLILALSWEKETTICIGKLTKEKLLNIKSNTGYYLYKIYFSGGNDNFYDGEWILGDKGSRTLWSKEEILKIIKEGNWIPIKDIERYKIFPHEFRW